MKRVIQANLALRFHVSDGWTRKEVANLLETKNIQAVLPSYFDMEKQNEVIEMKERFHLPDAYNDRTFDDCEYFVVLSNEEPFDKELLKENTNVHYS